MEILFEYQETRSSWSNCHIQLSIKMFAQISLKSRKFFGERLMKYFAWKNYLGQLAGGNFLGKIIWRVTIWGLIIRVDNYPVANWPEGSFPWGNCLVAIIRGTIMLGVVVWGRGGQFFLGQLSGGQLFEGSSPGVIVRGIIIWWAIALEP